MPKNLPEIMYTHWQWELHLEYGDVNAGCIQKNQIF